FSRDWSSDVCSSDLLLDGLIEPVLVTEELVIAGACIDCIGVNSNENINERLDRVQLGNNNGALECNVSLCGWVNNDEKLLLRGHNGSCLYPIRAVVIYKFALA